MSDSVRPHKQQPTRLPLPWDSSGKNTGVGCHFLLQCMKVKSESEVAQSCLTLSDPENCSLSGSSIPWDFPGKSTGVGHQCLLLSSCELWDKLLHGMWGSSWARNWTHISCTNRQILHHWATREVPITDFLRHCLKGIKLLGLENCL